MIVRGVALADMNAESVRGEEKQAKLLAVGSAGTTTRGNPALDKHLRVLLPNRVFRPLLPTAVQ